MNNLVRLVHHDEVLSSKKNLNRLSHQEFIILRLIYLGVCPKKIASQLGYSVKTVYAYKERIRMKIGELTSI
jgi:DNA-binding CsgD family transcriptional regulator